MTVSNKEVKLVMDLNGSIEQLAHGVEGIGRKPNAGATFGEACRTHGCGTPLWDGVYSAARLKMKPIVGRKALIVLSDGADIGSIHSLTDAIEAAQSADSLVSMIRYIGWMARVNPLLRSDEYAVIRDLAGSGLLAPKECGFRILKRPNNQARLKQRYPMFSSKSVMRMLLRSVGSSGGG